MSTAYLRNDFINSSIDWINGHDSKVFQTLETSIGQFSHAIVRTTHLGEHPLTFALLLLASILMHDFALANNADIKPAARAAQAVAVDFSHKPLRQALQVLQIRCGTAVKLPESLGGDTVSRSVQGDNWQEIVQRLLADYNYSAVWGDNGRPVQLTVYGRNHEAEQKAAPAAAVVASATDELLIYDAIAFSLPEKYQGMGRESVNAVSLPVEKMKQMASGETINLSLPCGQFTVTHENQFRRENGDIAWVGNVQGAGGSEQIVLTLNAEGGHGQLETPNGSYNLDMADGKTFLVDVNAAPVQQASASAQADTMYGYMANKYLP